MPCWAFLCRHGIGFLAGPTSSRMGKRPAFFVFGHRHSRPGAEKKGRRLVRRIVNPPRPPCTRPLIHPYIIHPQPEYQMSGRHRRVLAVEFDPLYLFFLIPCKKNEYLFLKPYFHHQIAPMGEGVTNETPFSFIPHVFNFLLN